jgi:outer membrane murein-binding lipoprotein Lpp
VDLGGILKQRIHTRITTQIVNVLSSDVNDLRSNVNVSSSDVNVLRSNVNVSSSDVNVLSSDANI